MLCKKCGAQIPDDSAKCEFCGEVFRDEPAPADNTPSDSSSDMEATKVIELNNTETSESDAEGAAPAEDLSQRSTHDIFEENAKKRKQQTEKIIDEKQQQLEEITMRRNQKKLKQKRNKIILIVCVCVLVAAAAGFGTYYVRNGSFTSTVIATPVPSGSPIPTLAPVATSNVNTPEPSATAEATDTPDTSSNTSETTENSSTSSNSGNNWTATGNSGTSSTGSTGGSSNNSSGSSSSGGSTSGNSSGTSGGTSSSSGTSTTGGTTTAATNTGNYSGSVSDRINSRLVIGDQVVYDSGSDRYFMTFNMDGTMYYANVSKGSTTEQVKGKYITVSAEPTNGRYNGNTVYEITSMTYYTGDYIIPDSGTRVIQKSEIQDFSKDKLGLARNEIYARHGRKFQMEVYQKYFEGKSWYKINPNYDYTDDNKNLNDIELSNVSTILSVENSK